MSHANGSKLDQKGRSERKSVVDRQIGAAKTRILYLIIMGLAAVAIVLPILERTLTPFDAPHSIHKVIARGLK